MSAPPGVRLPHSVPWDLNLKAQPNEPAAWWVKGERVASRAAGGLSIADLHAGEHLPKFADGDDSGFLPLAGIMLPVAGDEIVDGGRREPFSRMPASGCTFCGGIANRARRNTSSYSARIGSEM